MGGERETSVLIGDTDNDRQAALNAGVFSVLVTFGPEGLGVTRMNADGYLDHYDNLELVLDKLTKL
jgi:phosphoglycolate phosphatase